MFLRNLKNKIKFTMQRATKGFCDEDLYSIDYWLINIFPKMLGEFSECTCSYPNNAEQLKEEVSKMPKYWLELQKPIINKIGKKYDCEYNLTEPMRCWLLIILRLKYCFKMCNEWNKKYDYYRENKEYEFINDKVNENKKEAFYLFEKYFFDLWW